MEASRRVSLFFKEKAVRIALIIALIFSTLTPMGQSDHTKAQQPLNDSSLVAFTPEIVTFKQKNLEITVTKSQYQLQLEKQSAAAIAARKVAVRYAVVYADPGLEVKRAWAKNAASAYNIDWRVLEAVWRVESGMRWKSYIRSYAGATGPCQFMPGTWRGYAQDGNGDGFKDVSDARDCLFGASKLLAVNGAASGNVSGALFRYNHSQAYVNKVLALAKTL